MATLHHSIINIVDAFLPDICFENYIVFITTDDVERLLIGFDSKVYPIG